MATKKTSTRAKSTPPKQSDVMVLTPPTHAQIAERAFALFQARGGHGGSELNDWLAAERELSA